MKIATWNLERGGRSHTARAKQKTALDALSADVLILTEPGFAPEKRWPGVVTSPREREGRHGKEPWVAIVGPKAERVLDVPYDRLAVAARVDLGTEKIILYGSVLPWRGIRRQAPWLLRGKESFPDAFLRVLHEQKADIERIQAHGELVVWAGDFNQSLEGQDRVGTDDGRAALKHCLAELDFDAWNAAAEHAKPGHCAIDLICGPKHRRPRDQGRIPPDGASDHAGAWVELE